MNDLAASPRVRAGKRGRLTIIGGLVLAVVGSGAWWASSSLSGGSAAVVGRNQPVNPGAKEPLDRTANNSPTVRADPRNPLNLAAASRVDSPTSTCAVHVSFDGGASWSETPIPKPQGRSIACFAPDVAYGADGTLYLAFTSFTSADGTAVAPDAVWLVRSSDQGRTWSQPAGVAGPLAFEVRLSSDPSRASRVYLTWVQASEASTWGFARDGNPIVVARSDDGGATWGMPVPASPSSRRKVVAPSLVVDAVGSAYLAYLDLGGDDLDYLGQHEGRGGAPYPGRWTLTVARSGDHGQSWTESVVDAGIMPTQRFLVLHPPVLGLAVASTGHSLYVGFHDGRLGDPDVWVWASPDDGRAWSAATPVNDATHRHARSQYLPQLAVAPNGRLDVVYYDRSQDAEDVMNSVSLSSSFDGGKSFRRPVRVSDSPFDSRIGLGSDREMPDLGDRLGLISTDRGALAMWTDTRAGNQASAKQDLASVVIAVTPAQPLRGPLRWLGQALIVVGALLTLGRIGRSAAARHRRDPW